ncbi:probable inactive receptor kinase At2g26730 [Cynara cardunculus var. scolymus]|uniref:Leucine-rich repeat-containing protein n=1 Tax=Cynara cardunculus var. scolymus TaxID=59895 RepID=A0A103YC14_CYNCS|nr:probable inactive receptor kinase At2g26730 [Cynara cardunculus var. scolymus]KVI06344.1 Leucine-rich repeat-containing protein [Cynara cardunculus var. scolymus]
MGRIRSLFWGGFVFFLLFSVGKTEKEDVIDALVTFMENLDPKDMQNTTNWGWNRSSDPCTTKWQGVTCDTGNQTVQKIVLEQLNLSGTLDFESVCEETSLLSLSLKYNNLSGSLPPEISNCKRLRHLYLSGNRFSGNLPDSLTDLANLKRIDISNNEFSGKLPDMSRITGLLSFFAQNNHFTGQLPNFNYRQLEDFDVSNNGFSGRIPDDTGGFGAKSFAGNPQLCGKELPNACPKKKKKNLNDFLIFSGYAILGLIVLVLIALLFLKKKERLEDAKIGSSKKGVKNTDDSGHSSESKNGVTRSEFSITSAENGGVSASLVVLSSPLEAVNGLRFEDLLRAPAELIGRGKHGSLYKVIPNGGIALVVKRIKDWEISRDEFKKRMQRIDQVKHPKVLPVVAYYCSKQEKLLVYEFQQNGSLLALLHGSQNGQTFDWGSRLNIACSIAEALAFMHAELQDDQLAHGNLKSSNILLTKDMEACMSEYGLMVVDNGCGSHSQKNNSVFNADVYAFGVILLELLTGKTVQNNGLDLVKWVNSVVKEEWTGEVVDKALVVEGASEERMVGLLQIGLKCINGSPPIGQVATMIVSLKEEEERSMASSGP